jgi:hypothetical protein
MSRPSLLAFSWEIGSASLLALVPLVGFRINKSLTKEKTQVWCYRMQLFNMHCSLYIDLII